MFYFKVIFVLLWVLEKGIINKMYYYYLILYDNQVLFFVLCLFALIWVLQQNHCHGLLYRVSAGVLSSNLRLLKTFFKTCTNKCNTIWAGWGNVYSIILNCKITVKRIIYSSDTKSFTNDKLYISAFKTFLRKWMSQKYELLY